VFGELPEQEKTRLIGKLSAISETAEGGKVAMPPVTRVIAVFGIMILGVIYIFTEGHGSIGHKIFTIGVLIIIGCLLITYLRIKKDEKDKS
jgi:hypothetical protein